MFGEKIEKLEELLKQHIGNASIVDTKITRLTAPGDNFGSLMLKVDLVLKNKDSGAQETLNAVGKLIPDTEFFRQVFNIQVSFRNEIAFYDTIVPTLQEFQKEQGVDQVIDLFPKLYGARINLDGNSKIVDEHAAMMLENLKVGGYTNVDRLVGFDLETTKLILKDLATFHAVPLAIKQIKPEIFQDKIRPYFKPFVPPPLQPSDSPVPLILEALQEYSQCKPVMHLIKKYLETIVPPEVTEPFSTIVHDDMWVNNIMVKFDNGKPIQTRFVDFQSYTYSSPAIDLFFFLWTSVQKSILEKNLDDLIRYYHEHFFDTLQQLKVDTLPFSYENFLQEMDIASKSQFGHVLFMTVMVVFGKKDQEPTVEEDGSRPPFPGNVITLEGTDRAVYFIEECNRRGWLL